MDKDLSRVVMGAIVAILVLYSSAAGIFGFPGGAGDGDKVPSGCAGCHSTAGSGTVTITASSLSVMTGDGLNITVNVTEEELTGAGMVGVFLLKGPVGTQQSVTSDGWTIIVDPNGNTRNYVERTGLTEGVPATFRWALAAPASAGTYAIYAHLLHGDEDAAYETSAAVSITVTPPGGVASEPPQIAAPALPDRAIVGSVHNVSARITDDSEGVASATIHFKLPGDGSFTQIAMTLANGTPMDGLWAGSVDVGGAPGPLELYLTATDGNKQSRQPANGSYTLAVVLPAAPEIQASVLPGRAEPNSTLDISARISDSDDGVTLAVVRYRLPGSSDILTREMALANGTARDGNWTAQLDTGEAPGAMEIFFSATDGTNDARLPESGSYTVQIVPPQGPALNVSAPSTVVFGGAPQVMARASDPLGVLGVQVRFRQSGEQSFRTGEMTRRSGDDRDGEWAYTLPAATATGNLSFVVAARSPRAQSQSGEQIIAVLPDLYVSTVSLSLDDIFVKQEGVLSAVIGNRGDRPVTGLSVSFQDLGYPVGDIQNIRMFTNVTVPANGQVTLRALWVPMVDGDREISVVLNADGNVADGNGENNEMRMIVPVGLAPGMGIVFPIPTISDIWLQLAVVAGAAAILGGIILYGRMNRAGRDVLAAGEPREKGPAGRPNQGG